jgi:hypothetical protein
MNASTEFLVVWVEGSSAPAMPVRAQTHICLSQFSTVLPSKTKPRKSAIYKPSLTTAQVHSATDTQSE